MIRLLLPTSLPPYLILFITARCNARCGMCFYWQESERADNQDELTLAQWEQIARHCRGVAFLSLSGGEPTLRDDLDRICVAFHHFGGCRIVNIPTNGLLPEKAATAAKAIMRDAPHLIQQWELSLDALSEEHDALRAVTGCFSAAMETYQRLAEIRSNGTPIMIKVNCTFSALNQHAVIPLYEFVAQQMHVDRFAVSLVHGNPRDPTSLDFDISQYRHVIHYLERHDMCGKGTWWNYALEAIQRVYRDNILHTLVKQRMVYPCRAGTRIAVISERGELKPCEMSMDAIGNLRDANWDPKPLLREWESRGGRKQIRNCWCTWGCAILTGLISHPIGLLRVAGETAKCAVRYHLGKKRLSHLS